MSGRRGLEASLAGNTPLHTEPADRTSGRDGGQDNHATGTTPAGKTPWFVTQARPRVLAHDPGQSTPNRTRTPEGKTLDRKSPLPTHGAG